MIQVHRLRKAPLREETERRLGQDGSGLHPPGHATYDRAGQYRSTRQERSYGRNPWHRSELSPPSCRASEPATISRSRTKVPRGAGRPCRERSTSVLKALSSMYSARRPPARSTNVAFVRSVDSSRLPLTCVSIPTHVIGRPPPGRRPTTRRNRSRSACGGVGGPPASNSSSRRMTSKALKSRKNRRGS